MNIDNSPTGGSNQDEACAIEELADYLKVLVETIYDWNSRGKAPLHYRVGRFLRYRRSTVDQWLEDQLVQEGS